jgi:hypothetical protein
MNAARVRRALALASLPFVFSGCDLLAAAMLDPLGGGPFAPDPFAQPGTTATYEIGVATVEFDDGDVAETIVLDEVAGGSESWEYGSTVTWRNDSGWVMTLSTYSDPTFPAASSNDVTFQRISGTELWVTDYFDTSGRCIVSVRELSEERVAGSVECDGLRWTDGLGVPNYMGTPRYVDGQDSFHVHVEFEAAPDSSLNS